MDFCNTDVDTSTWTSCSHSWKLYYAIGGWNDKEKFNTVEIGFLKTVERYDVLNDKWEFVASMKHERHFTKAVVKTAVVFNKKIYVFGGYQGYKNDFVKIVECYDEETNEWKEVART